MCHTAPPPPTTRLKQPLFHIYYTKRLFLLFLNNYFENIILFLILQKDFFYLSTPFGIYIFLKLVQQTSGNSF